MEVIGLLVILILSREVLIIPLLNYFFNLEKEVTEIQAEVIDKRTEIGTLALFNINIITFRLENGNRVYFKVYNRQFDYYIIGDKGKLIFKGSKMIDFMV